MKISSAPLLISFEYSSNNFLMDRIIKYVNKHSNICVSVYEPKLSLLKKIKSPFISVDVSLKSEKINKKFIREINNLCNQIRIISCIDQISEINKLQKVNYFGGSKVIVLEFEIETVSVSHINEFINNCFNLKFIPSLCPLNIRKNSSNYFQILNLLIKMKKMINANEIFVDSPELLHDINGDDYLCPGSFLSLYVNEAGEVKFCKYAKQIFGNILQSDIAEIWKTKSKFIVKENCCLIE